MARIFEDLSVPVVVAPGLLWRLTAHICKTYTCRYAAEQISMLPKI